MKGVLFFVALVIVNALVSPLYGQDHPKAVLLDEFGQITWEDYVARIDNLINELSARPSDEAYIIIENGPVRTNRDRYRYEQWAKGQFRVRSFEKKRIHLIRAKDRDDLRIQFWIVPPGAEKPQYSEAYWSLEIPAGTRPFMWTTTEWNSGLSVPPEHLSLGLFAAVLQDNPDARANFVISANSQKQFAEERAEILNILVREYHINQGRLKFFYVKQSPSRSHFATTEVWLVPKKIR